MGIYFSLGKISGPTTKEAGSEALLAVRQWGEALQLAARLYSTLFTFISIAITIEVSSIKKYTFLIALIT